MKSTEILTERPKLMKSNQNWGENGLEWDQTSVTIAAKTKIGLKLGEKLVK